MSYKSRSISQEEYNQIFSELNTETAKNLFSSIFKEEADDTDLSSNGLVLCRVLSLNEYNKYIVNSTLDGAITANNSNVWRNFIQKYRGIRAGSGSFSSGQSVWCRGTGSYVTLKFSNSNLYNADGSVSTYNESICVCILSDNANSQNKFYSSYSGYIEGWGNYGHPSHIGEFRNYELKNVSAVINCNKTNTTFTLATVYGQTSWTPWDGAATYTYNLIGNISFRPVFQYVDNSKSDNIYR